MYLSILGELTSAERTMAKILVSLISFCQIHKSQRESEEKADDDQDQESDDSDHQDVQVEDLNMNLNIHVMIHHVWCQHLSPQIFGDLSATEVWVIKQYSKFEGTA